MSLNLHDYYCALRTAVLTGTNPISAAISILRARFVFGIGPRFYSLYQLNTRPVKDWHEFIIDEKLKPLMRRLNSAHALNLAIDKWAFRSHCVTLGLPCIPILARIDRREPTGPLLGNELEAWKALLADAPERIFIKQIDGSWGEGAFSATRLADGNWSFDGRQGDLAALHQFCMQRLPEVRGWIVQPLVRNHQTLLKIMSGRALGTIRAVTWSAAGPAQMIYAMVRIPVGKNSADNFVHGTSGNLAAAIDNDSGRLAVAKGSSDPRWPMMCNVEKHPDTGNTITGTQVPYWREMVDLICRAHDSIEGLHTGGWDVAITDDGPVLVELNGTYDVDIIQSCFDRGVLTELQRDRFEALMRERPTVTAARAKAPATAQ